MSQPRQASRKVLSGQTNRRWTTIETLPEVLIFLGAGASKAFADIPTMKEMVALFEEQLPGEEAGFNQLSKEILGSLKPIYPDGRKLRRTIPNLYPIFTTLCLNSHGWA